MQEKTPKETIGSHKNERPPFASVTTKTKNRGAMLQRKLDSHIDTLWLFVERKLKGKAAKTDLHFGQMAALTLITGCTVHKVHVIQQGRERLRCEHSKKAKKGASNKTRLKIIVIRTSRKNRKGRDG